MTNKQIINKLKGFKYCQVILSKDIDTLNDIISELKKSSSWVLGSVLNNKGIKPPKGVDSYKGQFWNEIIYCSNCLHEAYCDTDYGEQLFKYCPYCGYEMNIE